MTHASLGKPEAFGVEGRAICTSPDTTLITLMVIIRPYRYAVCSATHTTFYLYAKIETHTHTYRTTTVTLAHAMGVNYM